MLTADKNTVLQRAAIDFLGRNDFSKDATGPFLTTQKLQRRFMALARKMLRADNATAEQMIISDLPALLRAIPVHLYGKWYYRHVKESCNELVDTLVRGSTSKGFCFDFFPKNIVEVAEERTWEWYGVLKHQLRTLRRLSPSNTNAICLKLFRLCRSLMKKVRIRCVSNIPYAHSKHVPWIDTLLDHFFAILSPTHTILYSASSLNASIECTETQAQASMEMARTACALAEHSRCKYCGDSPYHPHQLWFDVWLEQMETEVIALLVSYLPNR